MTNEPRKIRRAMSLTDDLPVIETPIVKAVTPPRVTRPTTFSDEFKAVFVNQDGDLLGNLLTDTSDNTVRISRNAGFGAERIKVHDLQINDLIFSPMGIMATQYRVIDVVGLTERFGFFHLRDVDTEVKTTTSESAAIRIMCDGQEITSRVIVGANGKMFVYFGLTGSVGEWVKPWEVPLDAVVGVYDAAIRPVERRVVKNITRSAGVLTRIDLSTYRIDSEGNPVREEKLRFTLDARDVTDRAISNSRRVAVVESKEINGTGVTFVLPAQLNVGDQIELRVSGRLENERVFIGMITTMNSLPVAITLTRENPLPATRRLPFDGRAIFMWNGNNISAGIETNGGGFVWSFDESQNVIPAVLSLDERILYRRAPYAGSEPLTMRVTGIAITADNRRVIEVDIVISKEDVNRQESNRKRVAQTFLDSQRQSTRDFLGALGEGPDIRAEYLSTDRLLEALTKGPRSKHEEVCDALRQRKKTVVRSVISARTIAEQTKGERDAQQLIVSLMKKEGIPAVQQLINGKVTLIVMRGALYTLEDSTTLEYVYTWVADADWKG